ncbi:MAG: hypothetical protein D6820_02275 [Lentisphaerae bacterium]|nr:MAG: hypothetical protein D6820_02275 [Lentisphaerota bacterium]
MQEWIWQGISLLVPDDWEMLQYGRQWEAGKITFADRYQFRLELNWKQVGGLPDFEKMLADYQSKLANEQGYEDFRDYTLGAWNGFHCRGPVGWTTRVGRYFERGSRLIEVVFLWPDRVNLELADRVLRSIGQVSEKAGFLRWRAFGLDCMFSQGLHLSVCEVAPASVRLKFVDRERARHVEEFRRLGLVKQWLGCSVEEWLTMQAPQRVHERRVRTVTRNDHHVIQDRGFMPALQFPKFNHRKNIYMADSWICPFDERLYFVARIMSARDSKAGPEDLAAHYSVCCPRLANGTT